MGPMPQVKRRLVYCQRCGFSQIVAGTKTQPKPCESCFGGYFHALHPSTRIPEWHGQGYSRRDKKFLRDLVISAAV